MIKDDGRRITWNCPIKLLTTEEQLEKLSDELE